MLAHHERIDGHGYPDGLAGDDIPMTARILAIAEVYDVLTAPDSYKIPLGAAEAEDELRRVAGSQLDGRLVWLFVTQVLRGTVIDHGATSPTSRPSSRSSAACAACSTSRWCWARPRPRRAPLGGGGCYRGGSECRVGGEGWGGVVGGEGGGGGGGGGVGCCG